MSADSLSFTVAWFENSGDPGKPAYGDPGKMLWGDFVTVFEHRREGDKGGCCFAAARFKLEPNRRQVRRLKANLLARTAIALDIETSKTTGEVPPDLLVVVDRIRALDLAALLYTSHGNTGDNLRYRVVFPMSAEIPHELPAPEVMAEQIGLLGVLDMSKIGAASLFYLPSCPHDALDLHQTIVIPGALIDAAWMVDRAGALLAQRQAEADRIAAEAQAEAAARREAKIAAGFDPDDSLIEKIRSRLDLDSILTSHGYAKAGSKYRHPNSESGSYGADIKVLGGIERVFSHNGTDPLHGNNLPEWCGGVTAVDAFDVTAILDFGGDRTRALRELAERYIPSKAVERKTLAKLIFKMIRLGAELTTIEAAARAEGERAGLTWDEVCEVCRWVNGQCREAA